MLAALCSPFVSADAPADVAEVCERLKRVMERYPSGSYFTNDGGPCSSHANSSSFSCSNCRRVTAEEAGTEGNMQCFGFGRMVFWNVFGLAYPHYSSSENWKPSGREMKNVVQVWRSAPGAYLDTDAVRQAFLFASVGDVIHTGLPHTMVFLQCESDGILVYDANFDMYTCEVLVHVVTWRELARWGKNNGVSVYRAANYPELSEYGRFMLPGRDVGLLTVTSPVSDEVPVNSAMTDFRGLSLTYSKGETRCTLSCMEGATFDVSGTFGEKTVAANDGGEFSPRITVTSGSAPNPGRIRVEFLDSVAVIDGEVGEPFEAEILSFTNPDVLEYTVGENIRTDGASVTVFLESGQTAVFSGGEIAFSGFDSSAPGEYSVFMEAHGLRTPPFVVTVLEPPSQTASEPPAFSTLAAPASTRSLSGAKDRFPFAPVALGLILCAVGVGIMRVPGKNGSKRG